MNINNLLDNKLSESQTLEYKSYYFNSGKFGSLSEKSKNNIVKEITAFANSEGGQILIGIEEDEFHNPSKICDVGVDEYTFETWEQSFRQYISAKIKPVLYGIECKLHSYNDTNLILINISKSMVKPHAFDDGNKDTFYIRYGNTINNMRLDDLREMFKGREILERNILNFRDNRLSKLYSGEIIGEIGSKSLLTLHLIPEWSMGLNSFCNFQV